MRLSKSLIWIFVFILLISIVSAQEFKPISYSRQTSTFGFVKCTQTQIWEEYPCYLQQNCSVECKAIDSKALSLLSKSKDLSKGIPIVDKREQVFEISDKLIDEETGEYLSVFKGYKTDYLDYTVDNKIELDLTKPGEYHIGFDSNIITITDYSTGTCMNCTNTNIGVAINNTELNCTNTAICMDFSLSNSNSTFASDLSGNGHNGLVISGLTQNFSWYDKRSSNNKMNISILVNTTSNYTLLFWAKLTNVTELSTFAMMSNNTGQALMMFGYNNNKLRILDGSNQSAYVSTDNSNLNITINTWMMFTYNFIYNQTYKVYLNRDNGTISIAKVQYNFYMLDQNYTSLNLFSEYGKSSLISIDNLMFFNYSLTLAEVSTIYNQTLFNYFGNYSNTINLTGYAPKTLRFIDVQPTNTSIRLMINNTLTITNLSLDYNISGLLLNNGLLDYYAELVGNENRTETPILTNILINPRASDTPFNWYGSCYNCTINDTNGQIRLERDTAIDFVPSGNYTGGIILSPDGSSQQWVSLNATANIPNNTSIQFDVNVLTYSIPLVDNSLVAAYNLTNDFIDNLKLNNGTGVGKIVAGNMYGIFNLQNSTNFNKSQKVQIINGSNLLNITEATICMYAKIYSFTTGDTLFDTGGRMRIFIETGNLIFAYVNSTGVETIRPAATTGKLANKWHNICVRFNITNTVSDITVNYRKFVDNFFPVDSYNVSILNNKNITIGARTSNYFNGSIAYVYIYNRSLLDSEIFNISSPVHCTSLNCNISSLPNGSALQYTAILTSDILTNYTETPVLLSVNASTWTAFINQSPTFTENITNISIYYNESFAVQLNATDPEGDTLTYDVNDSKIVINATGYLENSTINITMLGNYSIRVNVTDGQSVANMTFNLEIRNFLGNLPPTFNQIIASIIKNYQQNISIQVNASDPDNSTFIWSINDSLMNISQLGLLTAYPNISQMGVYNMTLNCSDGFSTINMSFIYNITDIPSEIERNETYLILVMICLTLTTSLLLMAFRIDPVHAPMKIFFLWMAILSFLLLADLGVKIAEIQALSNALIINMNIVYYATAAINIVWGGYCFIFYTRMFLTYLANAAKPAWKRNANKS